MAGTSEDIIDWAVQAGLDETSHADLLAGYCERLVDAGVPLWRASIGASTLHPLLIAQGHRWLAGDGVQEEFFARASTEEGKEQWLRSPWHALIQSGEMRMRRLLAVGEGTNEFPLLEALAARGGTDYLAQMVEFSGERMAETHGLATSWTTDDPAGFAEGDLALVAATLPALALAFKATMAVNTTRTLATTYLGRDAAERILRGEIDRGQVQTIRKVLWFSDLTGFTRIADTLPREQLLDLLNAYADCLVGVVHDHQGEVLKFMGDGILAVFGGDRSEACVRALDAALAADAAMKQLNEARSGRPVTGFTLALHEGEVHSGNIGSKDRLDFTVVGPAVNELIRIQAMSRTLDQPILVSASFAEACTPQRDRLVSVGRYALRGVGRPQELFTLDLGTQP
jgi:adenylate cyclase